MSDSILASQLHRLREIPLFRPRHVPSQSCAGAVLFQQAQVADADITQTVIRLRLAAFSQISHRPEHSWRRPGFRSPGTKPGFFCPSLSTGSCCHEERGLEGSNGSTCGASVGFGER